MKIVNSFLIGHILGPIGGTADYDQGWEKFKDVVGEDEAAVKEIIRVEIIPYYLNQSENYKMQLKDTLAYYLTTDLLDFENEFDGCLIAFDSPSNPKTFFVWLWEVLFPEENYLLAKLENYTEQYSLVVPRD